MRIQPGFDRYHDFKIAWEAEGKYLLVLEGNVPMRPRAAARKLFPELQVRSSVAEHWGKYIDISEHPPKVLAAYRDLDKIRRQSEGAYGHGSRERKPCSEFFESQTKFDDLLSNRRLWEAFLEKRVLTTKDLEELTGLKGKGRSARLDHKLTQYSIAERRGDEFRLTDEARPFVEELLAQPDIPPE